ncbi:MAG: SprB repeat-containing protein, partial [Saprospiraceae bacterium]|nr:SprB repeat-containing protein [Saprospiraceae bacterium]
MMITNQFAPANTSSFLRTALLLLLACIGSMQATGQVVGGWNTSTLTGGTDNFGPSPFAATSTAANATVGGLTRGSGVGTTGTGAARGWGGNSWNLTEAGGISGNQFFTFTVKANTGYLLSLSSINPFDYRRSGTGPTNATIQYRINSGSYVPITTVSLPSTSSSGASVGSTNLSTIPALQNLPSSSTVTFRIIPYGASGATGTFYIFDVANSTANDFAVNGTVTACPAINFTATPTNVCPGGSNGQIAVSGVSGGTSPYTYSKDNGANFQAGATFTGLTAGMYNIVVKDANGCTSAATQATVGTFTPPSCTVSGPDLVCNNTAGIVYSATAGMSNYNWSISGNGSIPGSTTGSSVSVTSGNYLQTYTVSVTITDANGCTSSCSKISDIFLQTPPANITVNPNPVCQGAILDLSITAAASSTVSWSGEGITNPSGNPSTTAIPTSSGPHVYSVMVTTNPWGCTNTGTVNVTVNPLPAAPTCPSASSTCLATPAYALSGGSPGGGTYSGPGVSAGMFNPATAGTGTHAITYTITDGNGCTNSCSFNITVHPPPAAPSCPSNSSTCLTTPAYALSGGSPGGGTYSGPGVSAGMFNPATAGAGTHTITYTAADGNGCTNS